ncbi:MAG: DeoR/GlpR family DNA-binding transcription regulator [Thermotaleaceae bacterium]
MITEARRKKILELVEREGIVNLQQLVEGFGVSIYTIRRDLNALEEQGLLKKTHGGAARIEKTRWVPSIEAGKNEAIDEKKKVALRAVEFIENGDTIMLMGSTIALLMIPMFRDKNITVVTNSLDTAKELSLIPTIETILIGGRIKNFRGNILGSRAVNELGNYYFDKAFLPCAGINSSFGVSTSTLDSADFLKAVIAASRQSILIADYRKIGRTTFAKVSDLAQIDLLITDDSADKEELHRLEKRGLRIEIGKKTL